MNSILLYFLLANMGIMAFYLFFRLFLHRDTFFREKRVALLVGMLFALAYPLVNVSGWLERNQNVEALASTIHTNLPEMRVQSKVVGNQDIATTAIGDNSDVAFVGMVQPSNSHSVYSQITAFVSTFTWFDWTVILYVLVAGILFFRIVWQLTKMFQWMRRSERFERNGEYLYRIPEGVAPFSFFRAVFLNPDMYAESDVEEILEHERAHVRQGHTYDVLFSELVCVLCWVNPFAWLLKRSIRENLEFLADQKVLRKGLDPTTYQYHLLQLSCQRSDANLANHFTVSQLKKRIVMMNKKRTSTFGLGKYLLSLPLFAALLVIAFACNIDTKKTEESRMTKTNQTSTYFMKPSNKEDNQEIKKSERPTASTIRTSLNKKALFNIWAEDPNAPNASFGITEKEIIEPDYQGNGRIYYELIENKLKVYYDNYTQEGEILSVNSDTLKIKWKGNDKPSVYTVFPH